MPTSNHPEDRRLPNELHAQHQNNHGDGLPVNHLPPPPPRAAFLDVGDDDDDEDVEDYQPQQPHFR